MSTDSDVRVSVVMPTYNYGRFIGEAIESVRHQTIDDVELIVIDDGSTDGTGTVVRAVDDPRVEYIRTAHSGVSAARNVGLERARGEFVSFLDADDRWRPVKLARELGLLAAQPEVDVIFSNFVRFDEEGVFPADQFTFYPELDDLTTVDARCGWGEVIEEDAFTALMSFAEFPTFLPSMTFRAEALAGIRFDPRFAMCEDLHFAFRVFRQARVAFIREPLLEVRRHGDNTTAEIDDMASSRVGALRALADERLTLERRRALERSIGLAMIRASRALARQGRLLDSGRQCIQAVEFKGTRWAAVKNAGWLTLSMPRLVSESLRAR